MKRRLILLILGVNVLSCTFSQKNTEITVSTNNPISSRMNELLKRDNYVIPDSLFSFFPDKTDMYEDFKVENIFVNAEKSEVSLRLSEFDPTILVEIYQGKNLKILQHLLNDYRFQAISSVKSQNKDYFVLGSERELLKRYDILQLKEQYAKLDDKPLIFNFRESCCDIDFPSRCCDTTTISGLPLGYEILILKSGSDIVLSQDHLYEWSVLPDHLKHGYRGGVAFKEGESYIIYWVIAW